MKKTSLFKIIFSLLLSFFIGVVAFGQSNYHSKAVNIKLTGTSNLHDWEMNAAAGISDASFVINKGKVSSLSQMNFSIPVKNLKSGHTAMDNNTYKAMNNSKYPNISFILTNATMTSTGGNNYRLNCVGNMTIAGKTNKTELVALGVYNPADNSFTISGSKKMKMTDYKVNPPKALLGTIKTGDDISIFYNLKYKV